MGHKHSREQILDAAVRVAERSGLAALTFQLVADEVGASDRMVVYYFPNKAQLLAAIFDRISAQLQTVLAASLAAHPPGTLTEPDVLRAARAAFTDPINRAATGLFLQAVGLAVSGTQPFATVTPRLIEGWIAWLDAQLDDPNGPRGNAAATIAQVDGLLIVGLLLGREAENDAWGAAISRADGRVDHPFA